jgi:hypothetical protein
MVPLLILGLLGVAAYFTFEAAPSTSPTVTPTATALPGGTATLNSSTGSTSTLSTATSTSSPVAQVPSSQMPPDSYFIQAAQAAYTAATGISSGQYFSAFTTLVTQCVGAMQMITGPGDNCSGYSTTSVTFKALGLSQMGADTGLSIAASAGTIASATAGIATAGIGLVIAVIGMVFQHHAAKVKAQAQYDCAAVAAVNNCLSEIVSAIQSGQFNASTASQAFEAVYSQVVSLLQSSPAPPNTGSGTCNNPCNLIFATRAVVNKFEALYGLSGS